MQLYSVLMIVMMMRMVMMMAMVIKAVRNADVETCVLIS